MTPSCRIELLTSVRKKLQKEAVGADGERLDWIIALLHRADVMAARLYAERGKQ